MQKMTVPEQLLNESDEAYCERLRKWMYEEPRVKTDLKGFKSCDFTFAPERDKK